MSWKALIVIVVWLSFFGFWVIASFIYRTSKIKKVDKKWFLFVISTILITTVVEYLTWKYFFKVFEFHSPFNQLINLFGIALLLSGFIFAIWARITLSRFWSGSVAVIEGQPVIRQGPYSIVRHPIYTGVIAMLWGSFLLEEIGLVLFTALVGTILLLCKARFEEALIVRHNSKEYLDYKRDVTRMVF